MSDNSWRSKCLQVESCKEGNWDITLSWTFNDTDVNHSFRWRGCFILFFSSVSPKILKYDITKISVSVYFCVANYVIGNYKVEQVLYSISGACSLTKPNEHMLILKFFPAVHIPLAFISFHDDSLASIWQCLTWMHFRPARSPWCCLHTSRGIRLLSIIAYRFDDAMLSFTHHFLRRNCTRGVKIKQPSNTPPLHSTWRTVQKLFRRHPPCFLWRRLHCFL